MVCNKCYETTKNDNLLYGLRLTEINFINEEISAQQLHIINIFECKNQYRECVLSILNYAPHFTRHKIKNATDFVKKYHQNLDHISNIYFNKITSFLFAWYRVSYYLHNILCGNDVEKTIFSSIWGWAHTTSAIKIREG